MANAARWERDYQPPKDDDTKQHLVKRNRLLDISPQVLLGLLIVVLLWQIVRGNLPASRLAHWPWRLTFVDVSAAAGLAGGVAALIAGRRQFALTLEPHLGWVSLRNASPILGDRTRWRAVFVNSGGGRALIRRTFYRVALTGEDIASSPWLADVGAARKRLLDAGLVDDEDFAIIRLGEGSSIAVGSDEEFEVLALGDAAIRKVAAIDVHVLYDSAAGDTYRRTMTLIPRDGIPTSISEPKDKPAKRATTARPRAGR